VLIANNSISLLYLKLVLPLLASGTATGTATATATTTTDTVSAPGKTLLVFRAHGSFAFVLQIIQPSAAAVGSVKKKEEN